MTRKKKTKIKIVPSGTSLIIVLVAGFFMINQAQQIQYKPGMVRALQASLDPPVQKSDSSTSNNITSGYWQIEKDIRLHYFSEGKGQAVLVIHGGPGIPYISAWNGLKSLSDKYRFYYYDQRGCGKSTRPIDKFSSGNYNSNMQKLVNTLGLIPEIADIERIRRILGAKKLILIGHSFGGLLATLYAVEFPEHVKALVLVAPADVLMMPSKSGGIYELVKQHLPPEKKSSYSEYLKKFFDYGNIFSRSEAELAALNDEFVPYLATVDSGVYKIKTGKAGGWLTPALYMSMGLIHDYRAALQNIKAPVLVLHGENDLQSEESSRMYAELCVHSQFKVLTNTTHFLFEEKPEEFAELVSRFLGSVP